MFTSCHIAKKAILLSCPKQVLIPAGQKQFAFYHASTDDGVHNTRIDDNIRIQTSSSAHPGAPVVLLYSWLVAKQRHIDRFSKLYLSKGCDVVTVRIKPLQLMRPTKGSQKIAEKLVDLVQNSGLNDRPILVHTFSVGAYLHSETLTKMTEHDANEKTTIVDRIAGQVFDSAVDLEEMSYGTSRALFTNPLVQNSIEALLNAFMRATYKHTMVHYQRAHNVFYNNPASTPLLFFYSNDDLIAPASTINRCVDILKDDHGKEVYSKVFDKSLHVSHMYKYQNEYIGALETFLNKLSCFEDRKTK